MNKFGPNVLMVQALRFFFTLLFIASVHSVKTPPDKDYYHAAVVEYCPVRGNGTIGSLLTNTKEYTQIIAKAAQRADIVVFPENGLFFFDRREFIEVPFGKQPNAPANDKNAHAVLQLLSEAARSNSIYVVVNLHEKYISHSETLHYNTNIVLDRNGNIIARYRKTNLFNEPLNITHTPEHVYFDSDFGVRFGTFICFDILFKEPTLTIIEKYNVTDILYPTIWYSNLPFLTAIQTQAAWAYATDTNLLASGGNSVLNSNTGSGIYAGKKGPVVYLQSQRNTTCILFAKVIKKGKSGTPIGEILKLSEGQKESLKLWEDPVIKKMKSELITPESPRPVGMPAGDTSSPLLKKTKKLRENLKFWGNSGEKEMKSSLITPEVNVSPIKKDEPPSSNDTLIQTAIYSTYLCHDEFCCSFDINVTFTFKMTYNTSNINTLNPYIYRVAVFNGTQLYNARKVGVQFCSIISCSDMSSESCGKPLEDSNSEINPSLDKPYIYLYSTVFHKITIKTKSLLNNDSFTFPDILEFSKDPDVFGSLMEVDKFSFNSVNRTAELSFTSEKLITAAVYTRVFPRDDPLPVVPSLATCFFPHSIYALLVIVYFIF